MRNNNKCADKSRESLWIASPVEEEKIRRSRECTQSRRCPCRIQGSCYCMCCHCYPNEFQLTAVHTIPWAKANLNYTAQALIISGASIATYFITTDKTILECPGEIHNTIDHRSA